MAFAKNNRLRKSSLITLICKKGASWKTPFFRIRFLPAQKGVSQFCVITSKKLDKRAVYRNKMRRKLCASFDSALKDTDFILSSAMLCVIFPTEKVLESDFTDIVQASKFSLQKIHSILSKNKSHGKPQHCRQQRRNSHRKSNS